jgi:hypothetical protein
VARTRIERATTCVRVIARRRRERILIHARVVIGHRGVKISRRMNFLTAWKVLGIRILARRRWRGYRGVVSHLFIGRGEILLNKPVVLGSKRVDLMLGFESRSRTVGRGSFWGRLTSANGFRRFSNVLCIYFCKYRPTEAHTGDLI